MEKDTGTKKKCGLGSMNETVALQKWKNKKKEKALFSLRFVCFNLFDCKLVLIKNVFACK